MGYAAANMVIDTLRELQGDCAMGFKLVMLPPQTDVSGAWGQRLTAELP